MDHWQEYFAMGSWRDWPEYEESEQEPSEEFRAVFEHVSELFFRSGSFYTVIYDVTVGETISCSMSDFEEEREVTLNRFSFESLLQRLSRKSWEAGRGPGVPMLDAGDWFLQLVYSDGRPNWEFRSYNTECAAYRTLERYFESQFAFDDSEFQFYRLLPSYRENQPR